MKRSAMKNLNKTRWTTAQLVHLSESLKQSYGAGKITRTRSVNSQMSNKMSGGSWRYQQLLDMSAAMASPFL